MEGKVVAEWSTDERSNDTGSDSLMHFFAAGGLSLLAAAMGLMGLAMHFLPGY